MERNGDKLVQTFTVTFRFRVTNLSRTPGFVNSVELVPMSPRLPRNEIVSITRRAIQRGQVEVVEVTALLYHDLEPIGPVDEVLAHTFLVRPFDNDGRIIERYASGMLGRISVSGRFNLHRTFNPPGAVSPTPGALLGAR